MLYSLVFSSCAVLSPNTASHLFQALAPGLGNQEPRENKRDQSESSKEDVCAETNGFQHIGRDETDNEVAHPCR